MSAYDLSVDTQAIEQLMATLPRRLRERAMSRGINRAIRRGRVDVNRAVRSRVSLKVRDVNRGLTVRRAGRGENSGGIRIEGRPVPLKRFRARQVQTGVSVQVMGSRRVVAGAFIANTIGGHVFRRRGPARLPIDRLHGPSLRSQAEAVMDELKPELRQRYMSEMRDAVQFEIRRASGEIQQTRSVVRWRGQRVAI